MPRKKMHWSECATEAEEARWWDANPAYATKLIKKALKDGTAVIGSKSIAVRDGAVKVPTRSVTIRLPIPDIESAQKLAKRKGIPYQTYMKMLLHQVLEQERKAS